ncbi:MAG: linearmycin/streptolysin transport system ATP-binding protein [Candidatus Woesearchaeota archaeon]|nr:linearmycin/streptolysin transport system ATP-binding protein [Candidatus Woesearchaeota archaeon]MDN5327771.1 linearmycin/streptolysin transport system ATP-binding protein [Candidatus Woesearchaeota archaeon]
MQSDVILKVEDLDVNLNNVQILKDINLKIYNSEILSLVGPSGSGKTTLIMTLLGLIKPSGGDVLFAHKTKKGIVFKSIFDHLDYFRSHVGFSSQESSFYKKLSVQENLEFFGAMYSLPRDVIRQRTTILLDLFELKEHKNKIVDELSGGMKKRLDLAIALIHNPLILMLDEPTSELDPVLRKEMWYFIKKINSRGKTIILSSHFINDMESVADRIALLSNQKITLLGTPTEIRERMGLLDQIIIETLPGNYDELLKTFYTSPKIGLKNHKHNFNNLVLLVEDSHKALVEIVKILENASEKIVNLEVRKPPLEELFEFIS